MANLAFSNLFSILSWIKGHIREEQKEQTCQIIGSPGFWSEQFGAYDTDSALPIENKARVSSGREQGSSIISNTESQLEKA